MSASKVPKELSTTYLSQIRNVMKHLKKIGQKPSVLAIIWAFKKNPKTAKHYVFDEFIQQIQLALKKGYFFAIGTDQYPNHSNIGNHCVLFDVETLKTSREFSISSEDDLARAMLDSLLEISQNEVLIATEGIWPAQLSRFIKMTYTQAIPALVIPLRSLVENLPKHPFYRIVWDDKELASKVQKLLIEMRNCGALVFGSCHRRYKFGGSSSSGNEDFVEKPSPAACSLNLPGKPMSRSFLCTSDSDESSSEEPSSLNVTGQQQKYRRLSGSASDNTAPTPQSSWARQCPRCDTPIAARMLANHIALHQRDDLVAKTKTLDNQNTVDPANQHSFCLKSTRINNSNSIFYTPDSEELSLEKDSVVSSENYVKESTNRISPRSTQTHHIKSQHTSISTTIHGRPSRESIASNMGKDGMLVNDVVSGKDLVRTKVACPCCFNLLNAGYLRPHLEECNVYAKVIGGAPVDRYRKRDQRREIKSERLPKSDGIWRDSSTVTNHKGSLHPKRACRITDRYFSYDESSDPKKTASEILS